MSGWDILACADMVMPMYSDGINDMFPPQPWDSKEYSAYCYEKYGILPNYNYTLDHYGGVTDDDMLGYSNIFFSNGKLDPWRYLFLIIYCKLNTIYIKYSQWW